MRVVIAEDNALLRDGIALVLQDSGIEVVAAVADAGSLLAAVEEHRPDLAVVDVRMPPTFTSEGLQAAIAIRARHARTAVLVLSAWVETDYARRLLAENSGGVGYLLKDRVVATADFLDAARRVAAGGTALDPDVVRQLLTRPAGDEGIGRLTDRERDVLARLAEGLSNSAIAAQAYLSLRSVEKHITSIFTKLDLPPTRSDSRRVLAVLRYLNGEAQLGSGARDGA